MPKTKRERIAELLSTVEDALTDLEMGHVAGWGHVRTALRACYTLLKEYLNEHDDSTGVIERQ